MGRIRLTGATSGFTELRAANAAGNNTITLPTTTGGEVIVSDSSGNVNIDSGTLYVDAANNRVGIGTSSPGAPLHVSGGDDILRLTATDPYLSFYNGATRTGYIRVNATGGSFGIVSESASAMMQLYTNNNPRLNITAGGNVGIGTTGPIGILSARAVTNGNLHIRDINTIVSGTGVALDVLNDASTTVQDLALRGATTSFHRAGSESARIDSSGRLLVGTSTSAGPALLQVAGNTIPGTIGGFGIFDIRHNGFPASGDTIGTIRFQSATNDGAFASITAVADAATAVNDYPSRLVFSTTADGASSPTERMRISNNGTFSAVIPDGSTLFPAFYCRAWVNFNGTGTVAIRGSGNVSSITDHDIGRYTVNLTTAMPDTNYGYSVSAGNGATNLQVRPYGPAATPTTSSFRVETQSGTGTDDLAYVAVTLFR